MIVITTALRAGGLASTRAIVPKGGVGRRRPVGRVVTEIVAALPHGGRGGPTPA